MSSESARKNFAEVGRKPSPILTEDDEGVPATRGARSGSGSGSGSTPQQQQSASSPSLMSIKSFDSTVMLGNVDPETQKQKNRSSYRRSSSKRDATTSATAAAATKNNATKDTPPLLGTAGDVSDHHPYYHHLHHHHERASSLMLPTPLDVTECPLFCCFYAEFDIKVGPKVCFQSPQDFMENDMDIPIDKIHKHLDEYFTTIQESAEKGHSRIPSSETLLSEASESKDIGDGSMSIFDSCSEYIITGNELTGNLLNLSSHHIHILTRPTVLEDERYERNSLLFCVGFVLRRAGDPRLFRPILSKWALTLRDMEIETRYLSTERTRRRMQGHLDRMLVSLNSPGGECFLPLTPAHNLSVRLFHPPRPPPEPVPDHAVPVLLRRDWQFQMVRFPDLLLKDSRCVIPKPTHKSCPIAFICSLPKSMIGTWPSTG